MSYADGRRFVGDFKAGVPHGRGRLYFAPPPPASQQLDKVKDVNESKKDEENVKNL